MTEALNLREPRGCSAVVEITTLATGDNVVAKEVIFDCSRRCGIFERREKVGTYSQVDTEIVSLVESVVKLGCLKLNDKSGEIPSDFLPPVSEL